MLHISRHLAKWLATPENSRTLAHHTARALASGARMMADEDVQQMIDRVRFLRQQHDGAAAR